MASPYSHTTWADLKTALSLRLNDSGKVYWTDAELGIYLKEALRTWNVSTAFWRDKGVITLAANTPFYDLASIPLKNADDNAPLLSYTVTDQDLVTQIQYHLLEPATGSTWTGSEQFTLADITRALTRRRNQFIADTGCVLTRTTGIATNPGSNHVFLDDDVVAVRRLAFVSALGTVYPLNPTDILSQRNYDSSQLFTPGIPYSYSSASARPVELILTPFPEPGTLDLIAVQAGVDLDPATGVILGIPDDYAPFVKWGAMADLLSKEGPSRDSVRAGYCERRYQLGVLLVRHAPVVVNAEINGVPLDTDSLTNMDAYDDSWQHTTGVPTSIASLRTLVALAPCPDGVYSALFDVVCKAPIPANDTAYVQIGREQIGAILDYAEHLAAFKMAGEEFKATFKGADNFFTAAVAYNERLASQNPNILSMMLQSSADTEDRQYGTPRGVGTLTGQPVSGGSATLAARPGRASHSYSPTDPEMGMMGE